MDKEITLTHLIRLGGGLARRYSGIGHDMVDDNILTRPFTINEGKITHQSPVPPDIHHFMITVELLFTENIRMYAHLIDQEFHALDQDLLASERFTLATSSALESYIGYVYEQTDLDLRIIAASKIIWELSGDAGFGVVTRIIENFEGISTKRNFRFSQKWEHEGKKMVSKCIFPNFAVALNNVWTNKLNQFNILPPLGENESYAYWRQRIAFQTEFERVIMESFERKVDMILEENGIDPSLFEIV
ncbi:MAG TPA: hypothetical protein ENI23_08610 [bacterium]|nr:hypothetical protein [bacterium]